jgi:hemolysin III
MATKLLIIQMRPVTGINITNFSMSSQPVHFYAPGEERLNVVSHGFGLVLGFFGLIFLVVKSCMFGTVWHIVSFSIYGASMIVLYTASTVYHASKDVERRKKLNVFDHASIYLLIAGTYTPFTLVTIRGPWGWSIFGVIWGIAIAGIILKLFFTGRFNLVSTISYVVMGWIAIIAIKPMIANTPVAGLWWLFAGGLFYTSGAVLYMFKKMPYNHATFHFFVLAGTISHFIMIYFYLI